MSWVQNTDNNKSSIMEIIILSKSSSFAKALRNNSGSSGTIKRQRQYARKYCSKVGERAHVHILAPGTNDLHSDSVKISDNLTVHVLSKGKRITRIVRMFRQARKLIKSRDVTLITSQTPWEEGIVGVIVEYFYNVDHIPQIHIDITSRDWFEERYINRIKYFITRWVIQRSKYLRLVSQEMRKSLTGSLNISDKMVRILPVGIDKTIISGKIDEDVLKQTEGDRQSVLFVGRFVKQKNLTLWVEVAKKLSGRREEIEFLMVGAGNVEAEIKKKIEEYNLQNSFTFTGILDSSELSTLYKTSDVFLLTSNYEGLGRVVVESIANGLPVVATKCTGPKDIIKNGYNGYVVPKKSVDQLCEAVENVLDNELAGMSSNGYPNFGLDSSPNDKFSAGNLSPYIIDEASDRLTDFWVDVSRK